MMTPIMPSVKAIITGVVSGIMIAMLGGGMGAYIGSVKANQEQYDAIGELRKNQVVITNMLGTKVDNGTFWYVEGQLRARDNEILQRIDGVESKIDELKNIMISSRIK